MRSISIKMKLCESVLIDWLTAAPLSVIIEVVSTSLRPVQRDTNSRVMRGQELEEYRLSGVAMLPHRAMGHLRHFGIFFHSSTFVELHVSPVDAQQIFGQNSFAFPRLCFDNVMSNCFLKLQKALTNSSRLVLKHVLSFVSSCSGIAEII